MSAENLLFRPVRDDVGQPRHGVVLIDGETLSTSRAIAILDALTTLDRPHLAIVGRRQQAFVSPPLIALTIPPGFADAVASLDRATRAVHTPHRGPPRPVVPPAVRAIGRGR